LGLDERSSLPRKVHLGMVRLEDTSLPVDVDSHHLCPIGMIRYSPRPSTRKVAWAGRSVWNPSVRSAEWDCWRILAQCSRICIACELTLHFT
jgi:hypothetical protein